MYNGFQFCLPNLKPLAMVFLFIISEIYLRLLLVPLIKQIAKLCNDTVTCSTALSRTLRTLFPYSDASTCKRRRVTLSFCIFWAGHRKLKYF